MHYRRAGSGPALVLLHRSPRCSQDMLSLMRRLRSRFTCIAPDLPGHGLSDPLWTDALTPSDLAAAIVELLDTLGLDQAAVYGRHEGATLAIALALDFPDRVRCAVAESCAVPVGAERAEWLASCRILPEPVWDGSHLASLWSRMRDQATFHPWYARDADHRLSIEPPSPQEMQESVVGLLRAGDNHRITCAALYGMHIEEALRRVKIPVLLTTLRSDPLAEHLARVHEAAPSVAVQPTSGPEEAFGLIAAFLERHTSGTSPAPVPTEPIAGRIWNDFVDLPGGQLRIRRNTDAQGRVVVIQHDAAGSSESVDDLMMSFVGRRPVLAIDLPGHGGSTPPPPTLRVTVQTHARAVGEALDALGIGDFDFVGVGGGGFVGLELTRSHSRRLRHIVLADPLYFPMSMQAELREQYAPRIEPDWYGGHLLLAWHLVRDQQLYWPWYRRTRACIVSRPGNLDAITLHRRVVELLASPQAWRASCQAFFGYSLQPRLSRLEFPVLLCSPPLDPRLDHAMQAQRDYPQLAFMRMPEDRTQWGAKLMDFLDR